MSERKPRLTWADHYGINYEAEVGKHTLVVSIEGGRWYGISSAIGHAVVEDTADAAKVAIEDAVFERIRKDEAARLDPLRKWRRFP